jgi:5-methylcytosine-specific restriction endonuclease McrA
VVFRAVLHHRPDLSAKLKERRDYRQARRHRVKRTKLKGKKKRNKRYRKPTWKRRKGVGPKGWLAPSVKYREEEKQTLLEELVRLCPIRTCVYEVAYFDVQKMMEPEIRGTGYQEGLRRRMQEKNLKAAVKARDGYTCQLCGQRKKPWELRAHHVIPRRHPYRGTNTAKNLISVCDPCHERIKGRELDYVAFFQEKIESAGGFRETAMQVGRNYFLAALKEGGWSVEEVYGYQTAVWREEMGLAKDHTQDGLAMLMKGGKGWQEGGWGKEVAIWRRKGQVTKVRFGYKHGDVVSCVRKGQRYVGWVSGLHVQRSGGKEYPRLHVRLADGGLLRNVGLRGTRLLRRSGRLIYVRSGGGGEAERTFSTQ